MGFTPTALEQQFLSTIVEDGLVGEYYTQIDVQLFSDEECRSVWEYCADYWRKYACSIDVNTLKTARPSFQIRACANDIVGMYDLMRKTHHARLLSDLTAEFEIDFDDPGASARQLKAALTAIDLKTRTEEGMDVTATAEDVLAEYYTRKEGKVQLGIEWPWLPLQEATFGVRPGQMCVFWARPKQGKSFILFYILIWWKSRYPDKRILLINRELDEAQVRERMACVQAKVNFSRFKKGRLNADEETRLEEAAAELASNPGLIVDSSVYCQGQEAAEQIDVLVEKYGLSDGDIVAVDGMYFFADSSEWQSMYELSRGMKALASRRKNRKLIVIATTQQSSRTGDKLDAGQELQLGSGPAQDCDLGVRISFDKEKKEITLAIRAIRDGEEDTFVINGDLCTDMDVKYSSQFMRDNPVDDSGKGSKAAPVVRRLPGVVKKSEDGGTTVAAAPSKSIRVRVR